MRSHYTAPKAQPWHLRGIQDLFNGHLAHFIYVPGYTVLIYKDGKVNQHYILQYRGFSHVRFISQSFRFSFYNSLSFPNPNSSIWGAIIKDSTFAHNVIRSDKKSLTNYFLNCDDDAIEVLALRPPSFEILEKNGNILSYVISLTEGALKYRPPTQRKKVSTVRPSPMQPSKAFTYKAADDLFSKHQRLNFKILTFNHSDGRLILESHESKELFELEIPYRITSWQLITRPDETIESRSIAINKKKSDHVVWKACHSQLADETNEKGVYEIKKRFGSLIVETDTVIFEAIFWDKPSIRKINRISVKHLVNLAP